MSVIPTIVLIEDDKDLAKYITGLLTAERFTVHTAPGGLAGLKLVEEIMPSLVILDLTLPDITGESVCEQLKKISPRLPIIILTAKDDAKDIVNGLNLGADDYVTKPFTPEILLARIHARLRTPEVGNTLKVADLVVNTDTLEVKRAGRLIPLTHTEYSLLHYFLLNKDRVLTREMILSNIWAYTPDIETRVVDVYVGYLRKKIDHGHDKKLFHSSRGFGYMLRAD